MAEPFICFGEVGENRQDLPFYFELSEHNTCLTNSTQESLIGETHI